MALNVIIYLPLMFQSLFLDLKDVPELAWEIQPSHTNFHKLGLLDLFEPSYDQKKDKVNEEEAYGTIHVGPHSSHYRHTVAFRELENSLIVAHPDIPTAILHAISQAIIQGRLTRRLLITVITEQLWNERKHMITV